MIPTPRSLVITMVVFYSYICMMATINHVCHCTHMPDQLKFVSMCNYLVGSKVQGIFINPAEKKINNICGNWIDSAKDIALYDNLLCADLRTNDSYVSEKTKLFKYNGVCIKINNDCCYDNVNGNFYSFCNFNKNNLHSYFEPADLHCDKVSNITYFYNGNICGIFKLRNMHMHHQSNNKFLTYNMEEKCTKFNQTDYLINFNDDFMTVDKDNFELIDKNK